MQTTLNHILKSSLLATLFVGMFFTFMQEKSNFAVAFVIGFFMFLPLFISFINHKVIGIGILLIFMILLAVLDTMILFYALFIFIIPTALTIFVAFKTKFRLGIVLSFLSLYAITIFIVIMFMFGTQQSLYDYLYETIYFLVISLNSTEAPMSETDLLISNIRYIVFLLPTIFISLWLLWIISNYAIALRICKVDTNSDDDYALFKYHSLIFAFVALLALFLNNLLDIHANVKYTVYNVLFVLWFTYFYPGLKYVLQLTEHKKFFNIIFAIFFVFLFLPVVVIISVVGFLVEIKALDKTKLLKR